ncbi:MAG: response regulator [Candidatus Aminicenantia bacterium]
MKKKALIVEDESSVATLFRDILTQHHFEVELVSNGVQGYQCLKNNDYDLIISDIKMPLMNGKMLYQKIKEEKLIKPEKVILTSGDVLGQETMEFIFDEKIKFLVKPFRIEELLNLIKEILKKR